MLCMSSDELGCAFFAKLPCALSTASSRRYDGDHAAVELQKEAVYGLTELHRDAVRSARLVANPGCYPTSVQLPLVPLMEAGLILKDDIVIDAKSGALLPRPCLSLVLIATRCGGQGLLPGLNCVVPCACVHNGTKL